MSRCGSYLICAVGWLMVILSVLDVFPQISI